MSCFMMIPDINEFLLLFDVYLKNVRVKYCGEY